MKLFNTLMTILSLAAADSINALTKQSSNLRRRAEAHEEESGENKGNMVKISLVNQAYQQPFGAFFVMTHNADEEPLFTIGGTASNSLARLAEDGDPSFLIEKYSWSPNANYVANVTERAPYFGGESLDFMVPYNSSYPYVTIASMAINTNDCFVALNGVKMEPGSVHQVPGYDSGTEVNNELCSSIPGPACDSETGNSADGDGEGFVHIHRGFFGIGGELSASGYDWRNPMMRVEMSEMTAEELDADDVEEEINAEDEDEEEEVSVAKSLSDFP